MFCCRALKMPEHLSYETKVEALLLQYGTKKPIAIETVNGSWVIKRGRFMEMIGYRTPLWKDMLLEEAGYCYRAREWIRENPSAYFNITFVIIISLIVLIVALRAKMLI